jgi:hypothetical protein
MSTTTKVLLAILFVMAAGLGWLLWNIDWIETEVDDGFTEAAQAQRYLAGSLFLQEQGFETELRQGLALLDTLGSELSEVAANDTLILLEAYNALDDDQVGQLVTWVAGGGTAIYAAQNRLQGQSLPFQDYLLQLLNIGLEVRPVDAELAEAQDMEARLREAARVFTEGRNELLCEPYMGLTEVGTNGSTHPGQVHFEGTNALSSTGSGQMQYGDARGTQLLVMPWGKGTFVVTTDGRVWDNNHIACHDHAYTLLNFSTGNKAWFVENRNATSLLGRLWQLSAVGCSLVVLALFLQLHRRSRRFGPILATPPLARRSFLEHLEAGAQLLWDRKQGTHLIDLLRKDIHNRMQKLDYRFNGLSREQQREAIALTTRLPLGAVNEVMDTPPARLRRDDLQNWVTQLQKIRTLM